MKPLSPAHGSFVSMRRILPAFMFLLVLPLALSTWHGKVVGVSDGDTITVMNQKAPIKVRLYGIDCPEKGQAFGTKAKQLTSDLCFGKTVDVEPVEIDQYGRTVGIVRLEDGKILNAEILRAGFAWVYDRYCKRPMCLEWRRLEDEARAEGRGLWRDKNPVSP
ncbi:MAG: thermonuclease family protein [bacterium]